MKSWLDLILWRLPRRSSPPVNGPKDPWPRVLSLPGAQCGLLDTLSRWHTTMFTRWPRKEGALFVAIVPKGYCFGTQGYYYYKQYHLKVLVFPQ